MKLITAIPITLFFLILKYIVLMPLGWIIVPVISRKDSTYGNNEHPRAPIWFMTNKPEILRDYVWRAWRNPVNNMRYWRIFREPAWEDFDKAQESVRDPEVEVRQNGARSEMRFIWTWLWCEYWRVWRTEDEDRPIAEFRIGMKYGTVPGFGPTAQWRKGK